MFVISTSGVMISHLTLFVSSSIEVNTALRMMESSESGRSSCSDVSAGLLEEQDPGRILLPRGLQHIDGKGLMMLFWAD